MSSERHPLSDETSAPGKWIGVFARKGGLLVSSNIAQAGIAFLSQLILMRSLTPADFGEFAQALAIVGLVQMTLSPRLGVLAFRTPDADYTEAFRRRLYSAMTVEMLISLPLMLGWLAVAGQCSSRSVLLAATLALGQWVASVTMFYERALPYRGIAVIETGSLLAGHVVAVLLVLAGAGVASLYLRETAALALRALLLLQIGAIPRWRPRRVTLAEWRALLIEARVPWMDGIVDGGFQRLTVLAAAALGGAHGAGLFFQAQRLAMVPHQILSPVVVRLAGNIFGRIETKQTRRHTLARMAALIGLPLALAAAAAWMFAGSVVPWLFGASWREAGPVLAAMAGVVFGFSLFELGRSYCLAQRVHGVLLAGRMVQYAIFGAGCLLAAKGASAVTLGALLSVVSVASAAAMLAGLALTRGHS